MEQTTNHRNVVALLLLLVVIVAAGFGMLAMNQAKADGKADARDFACQLEHDTGAYNSACR